MDVAVVGGGIAGVASAVAAARAGASVCLIDKATALGGLATLGNVTLYLPLCDGRGRQIMGGMAEELLKLSVLDLKHQNRAARFSPIPPCWLPDGDKCERQSVRYRSGFNPAAFILSLEQLVLGSGIQIVYDAFVCAVRRTEDRISHLIVENKSGRNAIACGAVVDATGDADICYLAGEETESLDSNVLAGWFYLLRGDGLHINTITGKYSPYATKEGAEGPFYRGDDADDVTGHILGTRNIIRKRVADLRERHPEDDIQPFGLPTIAGFRMTRRLVSSVSLEEGRIHEWSDEAIGLTSDWRKAGPVWAIPYPCIRAERSHNLLAAGRCISADTTVWDVTRSIPCCAVTGEAAGAAAALAVSQTNCDTHRLPVEALQNHLRTNAALLDPDLVAPA